MSTPIFLVQGLGLGDSDEQYENLKAFSSMQKAEEFIATLRAESSADGDDDYVGEFIISELELD